MDEKLFGALSTPGRENATEKIIIFPIVYSIAGNDIPFIKKLPSNFTCTTCTPPNGKDPLNIPLRPLHLCGYFLFKKSMKILP